MLNQSYSSENFIKILEFENRKGRNIEKEFFPDVFALTKEISNVNRDIAIEYRANKDGSILLDSLVTKKEDLKKEKGDLLLKQVEEISQKVSEKNFKFNLTKKETETKPLYTVENNVENLFAMKQLQYNTRKSFNVKQANRFAIVNQINNLLSDDFPKVILRTDIKSFYESIPHERLLSKINENTILSFLSKKFIWNILKEYLRLATPGENTGIPRGIGISAYLAELMMKDIDNEIKSLKDVVYYARYVDDIIIVFTPSSKYTSIKYKDRVKNIIENGTGLTLNEDGEKTKEIELLKSNALQELNFLGYKFIFKDLQFQQIKLTSKKIDRYKNRIKATINAYNKERLSNSKLARKLLINRMNFLTSNTRLINNKENVLIGIYYSNSLLTSKLEDLIELDEKLKSEIDLSIEDVKLKARLKQFSFKKGFDEKSFMNFESKRKKIKLEDIIKIW
jgi:hypothetical protein